MRTTPAVSTTKTIFTSESLQDPYPVYANLCAEGPIHHVQFNGPRWALVRHLECSSKLMNKGFAPRVVAALRDQVAAIVDEIVGPLAQAEKIDIVRDVAYPSLSASLHKCWACQPPCKSSASIGRTRLLISSGHL
jgi:cytochrome P450